MKKVFFVILWAAFLLTGAMASQAAEQQIIHQDGQKTIKGSDKFFTGDVSVQTLYPANNDMRSSGGLVTFQPGARSN